MLETVQDEEHPLVPQGVEDAAIIALLGGREAHTRADGRREALGGFQGGEGDEEGAVRGKGGRGFLQEVPGGAQGQPRFSSSPWSQEGQEAAVGVSKMAAQYGEFSGAAHKGRSLEGKVVTRCRNDRGEGAWLR